MDYISALSELSMNNKEQVLKSNICGCYYCLQIFKPLKVKDWIDDGLSQTALCPYCGIDSVVGDCSGVPITKDFLTKAHMFWFKEI